MHLKIASPAEKNYTESSEETHQPLHVVSFEEEEQLCGQAQIKSHGQTMWSEQRTAPFLPPQVLYCSSSSSGCQGRLKKIRTQNLIRSKQRKSSDCKSELKFY